MTFLATEAFHLGDGHALDSDFREGGFHLFEFERLDDCDDEFHVASWLTGT
jgi:hypothetical protein